MTVFFVTMFAIIVVGTKDFPIEASIFPWIIGIPGLILASAQLVLELRTTKKPVEDSPSDAIDIAADRDLPRRTVYLRGLRVLAWLLGFYLGIWVVGAKIASIALSVAFLRIEGKANWLLTFLITLIAVYLLFFHLTTLLEIFWPSPLIRRWIRIDWLF